MNKERELLLSKPSARDVLEAITSLKEEQKLKYYYIFWMCRSERNRISEKERKNKGGIHFGSLIVSRFEWLSGKDKK
jgi:hypothetical protein